MEISLNVLGFTDFFYKEILTNLTSFSSRYTFSLNLLLKTRVAWAKNYEFLNYFLRGQPYWFKDISQVSELKFIRIIHFDGLCNYLHSFQKHPAANFFENKCCFPDQEQVGHYNKFTETGLDFFIKYFLRAI